MNRFFWIIVVLLCAFITSFLLVLGLGGIVYSGEEAIGIGMLWYYSLPGLVILGVFSGWASYSRYLKYERIVLTFRSLVLQSFALAVAAPILTYLVFWVRALFR